MVQTIAFTVWGIVALIILATFAYIGWSTRAPLDGEEHYKAIVRLRTPLFVILVAVLLVLLGFTLPQAPYPRRDLVPDKVVYVVGKQFSFAVSSNPITNDAEFAAALGERMEVPAEKWVEFRVTSRDVNHNFAIYSPDGYLLGQTQAMPGYVNRLFMRFEKPGVYQGLCLEYCGLAHHAMRGTFYVVTASKVARR